MRADTLVRGNTTRSAPADTRDKTSLAELINELANAGLVSAELGNDGSVEYTLTSKGVRAARQMAMCRDDHALVLLGALVGSSEIPT